MRTKAAKNIRWAGIATAGVFLALPLLAGAAGYEPLANIPGIDTSGRDIGAFFNSVFRVGVSLAAFLAVIMIVIGAVQYMGSDSIGNKSEGRDRIFQAVIGLMLILLSVTILSIINPQITGLTIFQGQGYPTPPPSNDFSKPGIPGEQIIGGWCYERIATKSGTPGGTEDWCFKENEKNKCEESLRTDPTALKTEKSCRHRTDALQLYCYNDPLNEGKPSIPLYGSECVDFAKDLSADPDRAKEIQDLKNLLEVRKRELAAITAMMAEVFSQAQCSDHGSFRYSEFLKSEFEKPDKFANPKRAEEFLVPTERDLLIQGNDVDDCQEKMNVLLGSAKAVQNNLQNAIIWLENSNQCVPCKPSP